MDDTSSKAVDELLVAESSDGIYSPLKQNQIRLVRILRENSDGKVSCQLGCFELSSSIEYIALSYTWGGLSRHPILLNGRVYAVRKNLWRFLREARKLGLHSWLWIDHLCIRQANREERMHQVGLMPRIYQAAEKVLIWLGPAHSGSDEAMKALRRKLCWNEREAKSILGKAAGIAIQGLCARRYWTRLWIVQEILLAQAADVLCGSELISLESMRTFLLQVGGIDPDERLKEKGTFISIRSSTALTIMQHIVGDLSQRRPDYRTLWNLLSATQGLRCSEHRDKVFALLGVSTAGHEDITADYTIPIQSLLNKILCNQHRLRCPESLGEVEAQCKQLASFFGVKPDSITALDDHPNSNPSLNTLWKKGSFSLAWATLYDQVAIRSLILSSGIVRIEDVKTAIVQGNADAIALLLKRPLAELNWVSVVKSATWNGKVKIAEMVIDSGVVSSSDSMAELMALSRNGIARPVSDSQSQKYGRQLARLLFSLRNEDVGEVDLRRLLNGAASQGHKESVEFLLAQGAKIDSQGRYGGALYSAAQNGQEDMVVALIERGADVNASGGVHGHALIAAAANGHHGVVTLLLERGANVNALGGKYGCALEAAASGKHLKVVQLLLDSGADPEAWKVVDQTTDSV